MLEAAIEAGADNVESGEGATRSPARPRSFFAVRDALEARFGAPEEAKDRVAAGTTVELDEERAASVFKLIDALDDNDDVQNVYANFDVPEDVLQRLRSDEAGLSWDPACDSASWHRPGPAFHRLGPDRGGWQPAAPPGLRRDRDRLGAPGARPPAHPA